MQSKQVGLSKEEKVARINARAMILAALIGVFGGAITMYFFGPRQPSNNSFPSLNSNECNIKIFDNFTSSEGDSSGIPVNKKYAPWKVRVEGQVSNAMNSFVYLIVDDDNGEWIQSGLGQHIDKEFSGTCVLGANNGRSWLNRYYTISSVVTNKKYDDYQILDRSTVIVQSNKIRLYRAH